MQSLIDNRKAQPAFYSQLRFFLFSEADLSFAYSERSHITLMFFRVWAAEIRPSRS